MNKLQTPHCGLYSLQWPSLCFPLLPHPPLFTRAQSTGLVSINVLSSAPTPSKWSNGLLSSQPSGLHSDVTPQRNPSWPIEVNLYHITQFYFFHGSTFIICLLSLKWELLKGRNPSGLFSSLSSWTTRALGTNYKWINICQLSTTKKGYAFLHIRC